MNSIGKLFQVVALSVLSLVVFNPAANAVLTPFEGTGTWGAYTGTIEYTFANANTAQFKVFLTNTSPVANGGYLTGFVFNNPSNNITGITFSSSDADFSLLGGPTFNNSVNGSPYGQFDIGASTSTSFEGGGNPNKGIAVGNTADFTFDLTGNNLDGLSNQSFIDEDSVGPGDGQGHEGFVARFRGFQNEESDKVPAGEPVVPEPATMLLFGAGAAAAFLRKRKV
jgi:hypothetical protein